MKSRIPPSSTSKQWFPCPRCQASTPCEVITEITSEDDVCRFIGESLNRAECPSCGFVIEAPVRAKLAAQEDYLPAMECVPIELLEDPMVLEDLAQNASDGVHRVYSHSELQRAIEAHLRIHAQREGIDLNQIESEDFR